MRAIRTRQLFEVTGERASGVYGSSLAETFIRDVIAGTDSLDVVTLGDSNTGQYLGGTGANGQGYTYGIMAALGNLGAMNYATPLFPTTHTGGLAGMSGEMVGPHTSRLINGTINPGALGSMGTLTAAAAAGNTDAVALKTFLGYTTDASLPVSYALQTWAGSFVSSANFTSSANGNNIAINGASPLNIGSYGGATSCAYRMNRGVFTTTGGGYRLAIITGTNTIHAASGADIPTSGAAVGYASDELTFTAPKTGSVATQYRAIFDGYNQSGGNQTVYSIKGPFCGLWNSIIRKSTKGYAVTNLIHQAGFTTPQIADKLDNMGKLVESFLFELRQRQISAGGSGRVLVFLNGGVNDVSGGNANDFITGIERIRDKFRSHWSALGYPTRDLCFLFSTTHPYPTENAGLTALRTTANSWATSNSGDNKYVTMLDISKLFSANDMDRLCLLNVDPSNSNADWLHLRPSPTPRVLETTGNYASLNIYNVSTGSVYSSYTLQTLNNGYVTVATRLISNLL